MILFLLKLFNNYLIIIIIIIIIKCIFNMTISMAYIHFIKYIYYYCYMNK